MSDAHDAIDRAVFDELLASTGGDTAFLADLVGTYLGDAAALLVEMRSASAAADAERLRRAAHSLKSNSATFGASDLAARAKELEMLARSGLLDGAEEGLAAVDDGYAQVCAELERLLALLS